jgi:hypothetical protein
MPVKNLFVKNQADAEGAELEPGELERAKVWAESLATLLTVTVEAAPAGPAELALVHLRWPDGLRMRLSPLCTVDAYANHVMRSLSHSGE